MVLRTFCCLTLVPGIFEQLHDLCVGGLVEVLVPEAYGPEVGRRGQAQQFVHLGCEELRRLGSAHGCGQDQAPWLPQFEGFHGGPGRHAGGEAVVDQDDGPAADFQLGPPAPEKAQPPVHLGDLLGRDPLYVLIGDTETPDDLGVQDAHAAGGNGPDAELRLAWGPELARDEHVERRPQRARDLVPYGDPAPRQPENHTPPAPETGQLRGELPSRVPAILERRRTEDPHSGSAHTPPERGEDLTALLDLPHPTLVLPIGRLIMDPLNAGGHALGKGPQVVAPFEYEGRRRGTNFTGELRDQRGEAPESAAGERHTPEQIVRMGIEARGDQDHTGPELPEHGREDPGEDRRVNVLPGARGQRYVERKTPSLPIPHLARFARARVKRTLVHR